MTSTEQPMEHGFSPYTDNGGTCLAVAGKNFAVLVSDTRMSKGYSIHTRNGSKVSQLTSKCAIASCGMQADAVTLHRVLKIRIKMFEHNHKFEPSATAIAQMLSTILYHKRFFPYYTFNVLAGVDNEGVGAVYHYDAIGSFERCPYTTSGSGSALVMSVLDNQIGRSNQTIQLPEPTKQEIIELSKDVLSSVGERDIYTGDGAEIFVLDDTGCTRNTFELKQD